MHISQRSSQQRQTNGRAVPRVWLVLGDKPGDNAQVDVIVEALGWPYEHKQIQVREPYVTSKPKFKASLYHIDTKRSDSLEPPWPDLVITIGLRPAMAALWIREQSGGRTKIVLIGKPDGMLDRFDLVVVSVEYRLPRRSNILRLELPLMRSNTVAISRATAAWRPRLALLPRPLIALLVGGPAGPCIFDTSSASRLVEVAGRIATDAGGTLYITTSRRTPPTVIETLQAGLPPGGHLHRWTADSTDNPYLGLLGLADCFIVTGDSVSMMIEAARLGKPVAIFPLPHRQRWVYRRLSQFFTRSLLSSAIDGPRNPFIQTLGYVLYRLGLLGRPRDLTAIHRVLIKRGLALQLGEGFPSPGRQAPNELSQVVTRIKALMADHETTKSSPNRV